MIPFQLLEQRAISAALGFANLSTIPSAEAVVGLFLPIAALSQIGTTPRMKAIPEADVGAFVDDRDELRGWLSALIKWHRTPTRERERVHQEIAGRLGKTVEGRALWTLSDGRLQTLVQPRLDGVQACYAFAAALLADEDAKRWRRLHHCALNACTHPWFWEPEVRAGPARLFCSDQHAAQARKVKFLRKRKG